MSVRAYLRCPVAIAWTLAGVLAVGAVVVAAFRIVALAGRSPLVAVSPTAAAEFVLAVVFATVVIAVAVLVWLPCSLAVAYAVGSRIRGESASLADSIDRVGSRTEPLYRWVKTRVAVGPVADRILSEEDVSPAEVAVGCDGFVIPALALEAPTLPAAVGRANRAVPQPGRERVLLAGAGLTGLLAAGGVAVGTVGGAVPLSTELLAAGGGVVGAILTVALDTAWRTGGYADQDLEEGF